MPHDRMDEIRAEMARHPDIHTCLKCDEKPRLGYYHGIYNGKGPRLPITPRIGSSYEAFSLYCPTCHYQTGIFVGLQAAITAWHRDNTRQDEHYAYCWEQSYQQQREASRAGR